MGSLHGVEVTDAGLDNLEGLTGLRVPCLSSTKVTDSGAEHLKGLHWLMLLAVVIGVAVSCMAAESPPVDLGLIYPNYRGLIFPRGGPVEVAVNSEPALGRLAATITLEGGEKRVLAVRPLDEACERILVSADTLPAGAVRLKAVVRREVDETQFAARAWQLHKLTPDEVTKLKVYVDRYNNTILDGEPFFPLGWYGSPNEKQMAEVAEGPFNCMLNYGTNHQSKEWMLRYLDAMQAKGLKLIYCLNDVYPTATYFKDKAWEGISGNEAIAEAVIKAYRDHPAMLAWYLNDELPRKLVPQLEEYYQRVKAFDPHHPCYIVLCDMSELAYFANTTDVYGVDPYPIPTKPVTTVSDWMEASNAAVKGRKPTWLVPQAFAWYQYKPTGSDRGRKPTEEELKTGRAPTYEEERCMTYLALTHGAKGLIYYCYYDLRVLPQYEEMWGWLKSIAAEVKTLSPVLLSPDDLGEVTFAPADAPMHTKLKQFNGQRYLMAVNAGRAPCRITFEFEDPLPPRVAVMFEGRDAATDGRQLKLDFAPLEVHVCELGPAGKRKG